MAQQWFQIKIEVNEEGLREAVANFLFEKGASALWEQGNPLSFTVSFDLKEQTLIEKALYNYVSDIKQLSPQAIIQWEVTPLKNDNWAEKYKEFYQAQKLTSRFFLRPKWDSKTAIPSDMFPLFLDPGQAFGTGLHASTRLSMKLMEDVSQLYPSVGPLTLLDVGTGSGILALAAFHLGFGEITAIDNDLDAVGVAQENLLFNQAARVRISGIPLAELKEPFDIIVANILLETHLELLDHYQRLLKPGGLILLAGLLGGQIPALEEASFRKGFIPQQKYWLQDWAACSYTHRMFQQGA